MSQSESTRQPLLEDEDALLLGRLLNNAFESFDAGRLTTEQGVVLYMMLDRVTEMLWNAHEGAIAHLYARRMIRLGVIKEDVFDDADIVNDDHDDEDS